jgi:hypothetical protein
MFRKKLVFLFSLTCMVFYFAIDCPKVLLYLNTCYFTSTIVWIVETKLNRTFCKIRPNHLTLTSNIPVSLGYIGCFLDHTQTTLDATNATHAGMTVEMCKTFCEKQNSKYYALKVILCLITALFDNVCNNSGLSQCSKDTKHSINWICQLQLL